MSKKRLFAIAMVITLVVLSFFSGSTFAKYLNEYKTTASFDVARWSVTEQFLVNGKSSTSTNVNLFQNCNSSTLSNGKIAPGTEGTFKITIDANGTETGVNYKVNFGNFIGEKPDNLIFIYNQQKYLSLVELSKVLSGNIPADAIRKDCNLEIAWSWPYETLNPFIHELEDNQDTRDRSRCTWL